MDHCIGEKLDLWAFILDGPTIPMKNGTDRTTQVPNSRKEHNAAAKLAIQNNAKEKKILIYEIDSDKYIRILAYPDQKVISETLKWLMRKKIRSRNPKLII